MRNRGEFKKKSNSRDSIVKIIMIFVLMILVVLLISSFFRTLSIMTEKKEILEMVEQDVAQLRRDNLELILKRNEIVSYEYVEKEARDKLKYSKDDEIVFVIPEGLLEDELLKEELARAKGIEEEDTYTGREDIIDVWIDFLFVSGV